MPEASESLGERLDGLARLETLRFITCGSVDDGKSTLIGRLLHDSQALFEDQVDALAADSARHGSKGGELDFALLVDGLQAEREQGITIDIAWRFFTTGQRRFVIADAPGHPQYTRNMATAASTATLAVILVDAAAGIREQTRRHTRICGLMGISQVVLAVNKIDTVDHDEDVFGRVRGDFEAMAAPFGFDNVTAIPVSALHGDMVLERGGNLEWYRGPTLMEALELSPVEDAGLAAPFRMPVGWVCRHSSGPRGYAGRVVAGKVDVGDPVRLLPSGLTTTVKAIAVGESGRRTARKDESVMLTFDDEVDLSRGDMIASSASPPETADQFECDLVWLAAEEGLAGRKLDFRFGTRTVSGTVSTIKHSVDIASGQPLPAKSLGLNDIARVTVSLSGEVAYDPYSASREMGGFIAIDRHSNTTLAAGMLDFALRRAANIHRHALTVTRSDREAINTHRGHVYWFTGLSGSGKSTIANAFEAALNDRGVRTYLLDGDNIRHGLNRDLGFSDADRVENIRRVAEVARLMADAGLVVLTAFISPFRQDRQTARELMEDGDFTEVFVDTPLETCEERDTKGLYRKARAGEIPNFTGISSPYEVPLEPECRLVTEDTTVEDLVDRLLELHFRGSPG